MVLILSAFQTFQPLCGNVRETLPAPAEYGGFVQLLLLGAELFLAVLLQAALSEAVDAFAFDAAGGEVIPRFLKREDRGFHALLLDQRGADDGVRVAVRVHKHGDVHSLTLQPGSVCLVPLQLLAQLRKLRLFAGETALALCKLALRDVFRAAPEPQGGIQIEPEPSHETLSYLFT
jgi:hypothetical protein